MDSPFPSDKVVVLFGPSPNWGPGTLLFCHVAITSSLINENKLFRQICFCYVDLVLSTNLFIPFKCQLSDLDEQMRRHSVNRAVLVVLTSLQVNPLHFSACRIVQPDACTPLAPWSSYCNSEISMSGVLLISFSRYFNLSGITNSDFF